jgi:hypothetical protein
MSRGGIAPLALLATIALAGCETTQQKSAQIAKRDANQTADAQQTKIGAASKTIKVDQAQLVHTSSGTAAAIQLTNLSSQAQAHIPIILTAYDAAGKAVYSNNTVGADVPSGELTLLGPRATVWWVNSNVLAGAGTPVRVSAQIGAGKTPATTPALSVSRLSSGSNFVGAFISGRARNGSTKAQSQVTIYAVALDGTRVTAAGEDIVPSIGAGSSATFQVTVTGITKRATVTAIAVPGNGF